MRLVECACVVLLLVVGCDTLKHRPRPLAKAATLDLFVVSPTNTPGSKQATDPATNTPLFLITPAIISAADVATVQRSEDSPGSPSLSVRLTASGAKKLAAATATPAGMQIAVVVNGTIVAAPKLMSPLSTEFLVSGGEIHKRFEELFEALTKN